MSAGKRGGTRVLRGARGGSLQAKGAVSAADPQAAADRGVSGSATELPFLGAIQASFGQYDVSGVEAHTGDAARDGCAELGASAFARGDQIAFAGAPDLHTAAHEAAHVVQQRAGVHLSGGVGREGDPYERHADQVADAVVAGESAEPILARMAGPDEVDSAAPGDAVQRRARPDELTAPPTFEEKLSFLNGLAMQDILDTLEAPAARAILPDLIANEAKAPAGTHDRMGAAMRAAAKRIDATFWMQFGRMHVTSPGDVPVIETRVGKKNMSAERRMGTISSSVTSQLRSTDPDARREAFLYLNGLNMHDILDVLVIVRGTGLLNDQFFADAAAAPIHVSRLTLAARAVDGIDKEGAGLEATWGAGWATLGGDGDTIKDWVVNSPQAKFKKLVDDDRLIKDGQFQLQSRIDDQLRGLGSAAGPLAADYTRLVNASYGNLQALLHQAAKFRADMTAQGINDPALLAATAPFTRFSGTPEKIGDAIFTEWWGRYQKDKATADVGPYVNVFALHSHHTTALVQCGAQTGQMAQVFQNARKAAGETKDPKAAFGAPLATSISRDWSVLPGDMCRGDVLQYSGSLADSVSRMKAALDGGWVLHIRVVSGGGAKTAHPQRIGPGVAPPKAPADPTEHSLLIIGYRGNGFVVSDADPHGEQQNPAKFDTGFTTIYFDPGGNRLSTAPDEASFPTINGVDDHGNPALGDFQVDGRHRYQVWSAFSV